MFGRDGGREKGFKYMDGDASRIHCCMFKSLCAN